MNSQTESSLKSCQIVKIAESYSSLDFQIQQTGGMFVLNTKYVLR